MPAPVSSRNCFTKEGEIVAAFVLHKTRSKVQKIYPEPSEKKGKNEEEGKKNEKRFATVNSYTS
jgi:hypothetical protein